MGKISKFTKNINVTGRRYSPSHGHETGSQPSIDRPTIYRAYRMPRLEIRPSGTTPGGIFHLHERGAGGAEPDPHTNHSRDFRLEDPPQFFGQIFWEKILEIKIVLLASPSRSRMKLAGSGEHGVDAIAIAASRVGS